VPCRGLCSEGPTISINDEVLHISSPEDLAKKIRALRVSGN
jgi:NADH:ubiquinone oxidoreductase subunit E